MVLHCPYGCKRERSFNHVQRYSFEESFDSALLLANIFDQRLVVTKSVDLLFVEEELLSLHSLSQYIEWIGSYLPDCTQSSDHEIYIPF